jgi:L-alanine-DL-glutamate epimerase-like enolase superfamily enzyme
VQIREVLADHYRIPLPVPLSDSTHGTIRSFEGLAIAPDRPGHGLAFDWKALESLRVIS